jgi:hypothetical protein
MSQRSKSLSPSFSPSPFHLIAISCRRIITRNEAQQFADENGLSYIETSAKSAEGVDDAFMQTAERIWEKQKSGGLSRSVTRNGEDVRPLYSLIKCF